jgi:type IV secretion system protein VirB10
MIFGTVFYFYIWPQLNTPKTTAAPEDKGGGVAGEAPKLVVPLDPNEGAHSAPAETTEDVYQSQPGLVGDAKPSASPQNQSGTTRRGNSQVAVHGRETPPGMEGHSDEGNGQATAAAAAETPKEVARARKMGGELGYFGPESEPVIERAGGQPATASASRIDQSCAGVDGGPEVVAECNRRVAAARPAQASPVQHTAPPAAPAGQPNQFSGQLVAIPTPNGAVGTVPNPHMTLQKGEPMTCTLDTAIQTEQFGFVECITDFPTYSMDGKTVLAERGTRITGEYSRDMAPGANTIFVLWTRGTTPAPHHVTFDLLSPGSDRLGRSGIAGDVDDKFWARYKGPLLFSVLQDASAAAAARASGSGGTNGGIVILPSTQNTGQTAVAELLKQGADIKPSLYRNQGETISITVARYIDFSGVYKLRTVKGRRNG